MCIVHVWLYHLHSGNKLCRVPVHCFRVVQPPRTVHTLLSLISGYLQHDGKWVTQYGSVMNELGQVVTWQLTNSTSFDEVSLLLHDLKNRIDLPEGRHLTIYVDNCCQVKKKLQKVFGIDIAVKLDLFHAVQQITRSMSKRHALFMHVSMILGQSSGVQML